LGAISKKAGIDYYRCEKCGNVWMHEQDDTLGPKRRDDSRE